MTAAHCLYYIVSNRTRRLRDARLFHAYAGMYDHCGPTEPSRQHSLVWRAIPHPNFYNPADESTRRGTNG